MLTWFTGPDEQKILILTLTWFTGPDEQEILILILTWFTGPDEQEILILILTLAMNECLSQCNMNVIASKLYRQKLSFTVLSW
jgi:hypothetical protein